MRHLRDRVAKAIKLVFWSFFSFHLYSQSHLDFDHDFIRSRLRDPHSFPYRPLHNDMHDISNSFSNSLGAAAWFTERLGFALHHR
jgi:hypothetical protein